jgi:branched-chain amino acid transport system permease protein
MLIGSALVSGVGLGSMYGLLALGYHVTYAASGTVNFAQGATMMLCAVLCFSFWVTFGWPLPLALAVGLVVTAFWGVAVERIAVRPFVRRGSSAWLMATVALGIVLENVVLFTFGKDPRGWPTTILTSEAISLFGIKVQLLQIAIPVVGLALAIGLHLVLRRTRYGKALLAVVQNKEAAGLMGISAERMVTTAYAVSSLLAGIAGLLVAPLFTLSPQMGTLFGIKAFAVAILGGIGSPWGVVVAGLLYGTAEALIIALLGSTYSQIAAFSLVIVALTIAPHGLFGQAAVRKV